MDIYSLLKQVIETKGSDLHLSAGSVPMIRVHGELQAVSDEILTPEALHTMLFSIINEEQQRKYKETLELDLSIEPENISRFRVNMFHQRRGEGAVFRVIPTRIKTIEELGLPPALRYFLSLKRGLVLVTGPTGSGKSTSLAALIDELNRTRHEHIITIEDPIEFVHHNQYCMVNQREVSSHTYSFANALKAALREDPDIILVGEMRDLETTQLAITAAETGHLVFATLHTSSAASTVDRIIDIFPPHQQSQIRTQLGNSLVGVVCQALVPRVDQEGRVCAMEIMFGTPAIRAQIREGKTHQINSMIQTSGKMGMQTLEQCLKALVMDGVIRGQDAYEFASNKEAFAQYAPAG